MGKGLAIQSQWARFSTVQALDSWLWDSGSFPLGHNATYYTVGSTYATIGDALAACSYGDIVVVPGGSYTEDLTIPSGVTVRAKANETVVIYGQHTCYSRVTFRDIIFRKGSQDCTFYSWLGGDCWFEHCTFYIDHPTTVFNEGVTGDITFNRCLITDEGTSSPAYFFVEGASVCKTVTITSCVFDMRQGSKGLVLYDLSALDVRNCTFLTQNYNADIFTLSGISGYGTNFVRFERNLLVSDSDDSGVNLDTGSIKLQNEDMTVQYNYGYGYSFSSALVDMPVALDATNVYSPYSNKANLELYGPRNEFIPKAVSSSNVPLVDFLGFSFETPASCGAVQFQEEGSSVYKPRFDVDLTSGFSFSPSLVRAVTTPDSNMATYTFYSHLECAAWINTYVQDVIHPSRGAFFVAYDGTYRLAVTSGNFDLDLSGDAEVLLGAFSQSGLIDTGA